MTAVNAWQQFGLQRAPFEGSPDPAFFYPSTGHNEALATLQYAVRNRKTCTLILGDSGTGKTLLARIAMRGTRGRDVLWIHGLGQPADATRAVYWPARTSSATPPEPHDCLLAEWARTAGARLPHALIICDNADGLQAHNWRDLLALATIDLTTSAPTFVLLGVPDLLKVLAAPAFIRLQRRMFRTCRLARLLPIEVGHYITHRLSAAGGDGRELFTATAVDLIHRFTGGNPALINQLCDNALVDAFGEDRVVIEAPHIVATVHNITGGLQRRRYLPEPVDTQPAHRTVFDDVRSTQGLRRVVASKPVTVTRDPPENTAAPIPPQAATQDFCEVQPATESVRSDSMAEVEIVDATPSTDDDAPFDLSDTPLDERLRALEARLSDALHRVRGARVRPALPLEPCASSAPDHEPEVAPDSRAANYQPNLAGSGIPGTHP
ncbi:MAG: AAA family ATPase [Phycisphaerales bacterium]|nr:AAA family ATPase [Phycisphaerales bacterium]